MTEYLSAAAASRRYGVSDKTIRKWITQGKLPAIERHIEGLKQHAISTEDIELLIAQRTTERLPEYTGISITERLETLERRVSELEQKSHDQRMTQPTPQTYTVPRVTATSHKTYSTKKQLPPGWASWNNFLEQHGLPPSSFDKRDYVEAGQEYLAGNVTVRNPLSEVGQDMLLKAGQGRYPNRIHQCTVEACLCHELLAQ